MPTRDTKPGLDTFLAIVLSSTSETEIVMAARKAQGLLKAEGRAWHEIPELVKRRDELGAIATERDAILATAQRLQIERDRALAEVKRLRSEAVNGHGNSFTQQLWQSAGAPITLDNRAAQWVLDLAAQGQHRLTPKEISFLQSCANRRRLSDAQKSWLKDITDLAIARTGQTPPP